MSKETEGKNSVALITQRPPPTLNSLPPEIHQIIFENLAGRVTSTCLGLTCRKFYGIHWSIHGKVRLWDFDDDEAEEDFVRDEEGEIEFDILDDFINSWFTGDSSFRPENLFLWQFIDKWGGGGEHFKIHCPCVAQLGYMTVAFVTESQWRKRAPCREHRNMGGRGYGHFLVGGDIVVASVWKKEEPVVEEEDSKD